MKLIIVRHGQTNLNKQGRVLGHGPEPLNDTGRSQADAVAKAAHKLKSSSRAVGANALADLCLALETAGKAEDWQTIDAEAPKLPPTLDLVLDYIAAL